MLVGAELSVPSLVVMVGSFVEKGSNIDLSHPMKAVKDPVGEVPTFPKVEGSEREIERHGVLLNVPLVCDGDEKQIYW